MRQKAVVSLAEFSRSTSSLAKDLTTRMPRRLSSHLGVELAHLDGEQLRRPAFAVEMQGEEKHGRQQRKDDEGQPDVHAAQDDERGDDFDAGDEEFLGAVVGELGHLKKRSLVMRDMIWPILVLS